MGACGVGLAAVHRYAGDMPACGAAPGGPATLVRRNDRFSFAPTDGALVISGAVAEDGSFSGTLTTATSHRDQSSGTSAPPFALSVEGRLDDDAASGTYATPRCRTEFHLPRIPASLLP